MHLPETVPPGGKFPFRYPAQEAFLAVLRREKAEISGFPEGKKRFPEAETGLTEAKTASERRFRPDFRKNLDN